VVTGAVTAGALTNMPYEALCPGNAKLQELMEEYE
jgi:hypothetical protein